MHSYNNGVSVFNRDAVSFRGCFALPLSLLYMHDILINLSPSIVMKIRILFPASLALLVVAAFSIALTSCGEQHGTTGGTAVVDTSGGPVTGDWVVIHSLSDPETLNLITASDAQASELQAYIYETLVTTDPVTLKYIPWIADSLPTISADNKVYEFHLRKEAHFSDGKPITGEDFIFYLKTIKNPLIEKAASIAGYYSRVDSAYLIDGDPYRLRVVMHEPYYLGEQFAGGLYAFPKHIWDPKNLSDNCSFKEFNAGDTTNPATGQYASAIEEVERGMSKQYLVGSGPYVFREWRRNDRVVLERNPNFWNPKSSLGKAYPERLMWRTVTDYNPALVALRAGELDVMPKMEKVQYIRTKAIFPNIGLTPTEYDYPAYVYIGYNGSRSIFRDAAVRRAISHAINRDAIVEKIYFGMARPVQSPIFYKRPECDTTLPIIKYDLAVAAKMLDEAGWKDSDGDGMRDKVLDGKKTTFRFSIMLNQGNQARQQMAILLVSELKRIGIDASTETLDWSTYLKRLDGGEFDAYIGGWVMGVVEGDMYQIWHSKSAETGGSNRVQFKNPEVDKLIETIRGEFDFIKRLDLYRQIQRVINDEQPYNFLVSEIVTGAYSNRFRGVSWFPVAPCYNPGWWWTPVGAQRYRSTPAMALN